MKVRCVCIYLGACGVGHSVTAEEPFRCPAQCHVLGTQQRTEPQVQEPPGRSPGGLEADRRPKVSCYHPNLCPQLEPLLHSYSLCVAPVSVHLSVCPSLCTYWSVPRGGAQSWPSSHSAVTFPSIRRGLVGAPRPVYCEPTAFTVSGAGRGRCPCPVPSRGLSDWKPGEHLP